MNDFDSLLNTTTLTYSCTLAELLLAGLYCLMLTYAGHEQDMDFIFRFCLTHWAKRIILIVSVFVAQQDRNSKPKYAICISNMLLF